MPKSRNSLLIALALVAVAACSPSAESTGAPSPEAPTTGASMSGAPAPSASPNEAPTTSIIVRDMELEPADVTLPAGAIRFEVINEGPTPHNVAIRQGEGDLLATSPDLSRDETGTLDAMLEAGDYILYCTLPGHESLGVVGTLTVTP